MRTARVRRGGWGCGRLGEALWPGLEYGLKLMSFHGAASATHECGLLQHVQDSRRRPALRFRSQRYAHWRETCVYPCSGPPHSHRTELYQRTHPTAVSALVQLFLSGSDALRRKGTRKSVTLGITPHRASGSGCGSNRDVPACLKHSGASPGKARCSELIAIDAQSTSPHDLPDVLGCAYRPRRCARCSIRGSVRPG